VVDRHAVEGGAEAEEVGGAGDTRDRVFRSGYDSGFRREEAARDERTGFEHGALDGERLTGKAGEKQFKLSKESATAEFNRIVEEFNFNISTEAKERIVTMKMNGIDMQTSQELIEADSFIQKIMAGRIRFDEENKQIVYTLRDPAKSGEGPAISEFRFGKFTRSMQLASKVPLNRCNFTTMTDEEQTNLLRAMTGVSDDGYFASITISEFNALRMIGGYFFN